MNVRWIYILAVVLILILVGGAMFNYFKRDQPASEIKPGELIALPQPASDSQTSIEKALLERRSIRNYSSAPLSLPEISQLLWAAQGITRPGGYRTAPSAGALYPLEVYLISGDIDQLPAGVYRYHPEGHKLEQLIEGDVRRELSSAALNQEFVQDAPAVILISAVYERTTGKYGQRGIQYVHMEVGSVAENIYLQAQSLDLGTVFIGAFHDDQVRQVVGLDPGEHPLCIMPVGKVQP
jgi:SagB-type dehydrogenase family enzyme